MSKEEKKDSMANPFTGAVTCLGAALCVWIGAAIRGHSIHDEAIAYLAGMGITGAIAGTVGMFTIPNTDDSSSSKLSICSSIWKAALANGATVTGPFMATLLVENSSTPIETVEDCYIGGAVISSSIIGLVALAYASTIAISYFNSCTLFSPSAAGSTENVNNIEDCLTANDNKV